MATGLRRDASAPSSSEPRATRHTSAQRGAMSARRDDEEEAWESASGEDFNDRYSPDPDFEFRLQNPRQNTANDRPSSTDRDIQQSEYEDADRIEVLDSIEGEDATEAVVRSPRLEGVDSLRLSSVDRLPMRTADTRREERRSPDCDPIVGRQPGNRRHLGALSTAEIHRHPQAPVPVAPDRV